MNCQKYIREEREIQLFIHISKEEKRHRMFSMTSALVRLNARCRSVGSNGDNDRGFWVNQ